MIIPDDDLRWPRLRRGVVRAAMLAVAAAPLGAESLHAEGADTIPIPAAGSRTLFGPAFWSGVREAARSIREFEHAPDRYARRYDIAPELATTIIAAAVAEGLDPELVFRLIRAESRFNPRARGPQGALGLMQLMPSTARALDRSIRSEAEILDPQTNLRLGLRYLRRMIDRYGGDVRLGLLAYNRGPIAVDRALQRRQDPENGYTRRVLGGANAYRGPGLLAH